VQSSQAQTGKAPVRFGIVAHAEEYGCRRWQQLVLGGVGERTR
jgi:hypothetical protein